MTKDFSQNKGSALKKQSIEALVTMKQVLPVELRLEHVVTEWVDEYGNDRSHALLVMPSGMSVDDVSEVVVVGSHLRIRLKWPADMFSAKRILSHARFNDHYHPGHPKWIALQRAQDEAMGNKDFFESTIKIRLPGSDYAATCANISGHEPCTIFHEEKYSDGGEVIPQKTTIRCLVDCGFIKKPTDTRGGIFLSHDPREPTPRSSRFP